MVPDWNYKEKIEPNFKFQGRYQLITRSTEKEKGNQMH
jgi:hypothetical protein